MVVAACLDVEKQSRAEARRGERPESAMNPWVAAVPLCVPGDLASYRSGMAGRGLGLPS